MLTGEEKIYLVGGGRNYDMKVAELAEYLAGQGVSVTIVANDISDASDVGKNVLKAATQVLAQRALGATDIGVALFTSTNQLMAATAIGNASTTTRGCVYQAAARANSAATDVPGVNTVLNDLLAKLRTAGVLAT